jgi:hypothetical protein
MSRMADSPQRRFFVRVGIPLIGLVGAAGIGLGLAIVEGSPAWGFAGAIIFGGVMTLVGLAILALQSALVRERRELRDTRSALEAMRKSPVDEAHRHQIQRICVSVTKSVQGKRRIDWREPMAASNPRSPIFKQSLLAHCPELARPSEQWDVAADALSERKKELRSFVLESARKRFSVPWIPDGIAGALNDYVPDLVSKRKPKRPLSGRTTSRVVKSRDADGQMTVVSKAIVSIRGQPVMELRGETQPHPDTLAIKNQLEEFAVEMASSPAGRRYGDAIMEADSISRAVLPLAGRITETMSISRGDGCPLCR